jgi:hypothetical protein
MGSGTDPAAPHPARHVRHRPGPVSAFPGRLSAGTERNPARRLALHGPPERAPPASGTPMASASPRCLPHVTTNPERPSSRLVLHVRDPSGSGSARIMARGRRVGKKWRGIWVGVSWLKHAPSPVMPDLIRHPAGERPRAGRPFQVGIASRGSPAPAEAVAAGSRIKSGMTAEMRGPQSPSLRGRCRHRRQRGVALGLIRRAGE